jgi:hypothetical protein
VVEAVKAGPVLARVEATQPVTEFPLPALALLQDVGGRDYMLVLAEPAELDVSGWPWRVLAVGTNAEAFVVATEMRPGARAAAAGRFKPAHDDGWHLILEATESDAEALATLGFGLQRLTGEPLIWPKPTPPPLSKPGDGPMPDARVSAMVASVQTTNLWWLLRRLTGVEPVVAGGEPQLLTTRNTATGLPVRKATELVFERFQSLALNPVYHGWTQSIYSNRNVIATLPGTLHSNELVLVTAHLDDMPTGSLAPGADDNASGSAAVLTAAGILSQYQFERSIRFILFTGEEQGLYGSAKYAAAAQTNGDNIVGVVNLDMLGWNGGAPNTFQLHTRSTSSPGFTNDLAIARTFTNAALAYNLLSNLAPVIKPDAINASDHASFWNKGYAAICAIEDYGTDFNPYYHTTNDTLARINLPYYTDAVRGAVATVAHLAYPVTATGMDAVEIVAGNWTPGGGIGSGVFVARHLPLAAETGLDPYDVAATNAPPDPDPAWLEQVTAPDGVELVIDSRPTLSESAFSLSLAAVATNGGSITCSNRLRFDFPAPVGATRLYTARVQMPQPAPGPDFTCYTNLRQVVEQGGFIELPPLQAALPGSYGLCEVYARFLDTNRVNCQLRVSSLQSSTLWLATDAQIGARIVDTLEYCTNLHGSTWAGLATFTNDVAPDAASFSSGWKELLRPVDLATLPAAQQYYVRINRVWLP